MSGRFQSVLQAVVVAFVSLLATVPVGAQSEADIRGRVVAEADGSALTDATVTLTTGTGGLVREVSVDESGRFVLLEVVPGDYVLSASSTGFLPRELRLTLEPREVRSVALSLGLRGIEVEVDVTGTAPTLASTHSPSSTVLAAARITALPPDLRSSLPEAIVTVAPGMIRGHDDFVHVRGQELALNTLINGVSFWENPHTLFSAGLSPMVIDTANVMTGGFPAEYGNRFGGVVDIVTKSGLRMENRGSASFSGGQAGRMNAAVEIGGRRRGFAYYAFGSLFESDRFLSPPDPESIHNSGRSGHGFFQLDKDLGSKGLVRVLLMGDGVSFEIPRTPLDLELRPQALPEQRNRQQSAIVGWTRAAGTAGTTGISASFYQRWSNLDLRPAEGPLTASASLDQTVLTFGGKFDVSRISGRHAVKAGVDAVLLRPDEDLVYDYGGYRELSHDLGLEHFHVEDDVISFAGRETGGQVSAYVQDTIELGERVSADVGLRLDQYEIVVSATHLSPRVNLAFQAGGGAVVHASYNHYFVPPPIEGLLSSSAGLTEQIHEVGVPLPPLEPTTEDQFEVGATAPVGPVRLGLTGYYRASDNQVHTTVWPDARLYSYASFDRAEAYGLEARADVLTLARYGMTGYFNYALGRVEFWNPVTGGFITEADHLTANDSFLAPMDQTHTLTAGFTYRHAPSGLWAGTALEYGSGTPMGHGGGHDHGAAEEGHDEGEHGAEEAEHTESGGAAARVPGHFTADLSFGIDVVREAKGQPRLSFQIDIRNIADNVYLIAQEGVFTPGQYYIPRLISATATVTF